MKRVIKIFLLLGLAVVVASSQEQINAMKVPGNVSKIGPLSRAWLSAEYVDVILYPHTSIKKVDFEVGMNDENVKSKNARIKALYDGENLSLLIEWKDDTINVQENCCSKTHADGFALQFPVDYSDVEKLPYINMGSKDRSVVVHLRKAAEQKRDVYFQSMQEYFDTHQKPLKESAKIDNGRVFISEGYRFVKEIKDNSTSVVMNMVYKDGTWKATLTRPLKSEYLDLTNGTFPISIVTWNGSLSNVERMEYISSWVGVKLFGMNGGDELLESLKSQVEGDIDNGKRLAIENCAACHNFADSVTAPENMAPNLSNIGGYSTVQYLLESIIDPNAVMTPGYNPKAQSNFPWYNLDEAGNQISTMPSYDWMDEKSIEDLVTYFKTLKADLEE